MEHLWNDTKRGQQALEQVFTCSTANLTTINLAWNCPDSIPGPHDENLAINCISHVTCLKTILTRIIYKNSVRTAQ
jgi:hypothetical protein